MNERKPMLEWLKTPSGAYNLTLIVAIFAWLIGGVAIYAGFHLNKVRLVDAQRKTRQSEDDKARMKADLDETTRKLEDARAKVIALEESAKPRTLAEARASAFTARLRSAVASNRADTYIVVAARMMDAESISYAKQLFHAVSASGWPCSFTELSTHSFPGVTIYYNPEDGLKPGLAIVRDAAASAGIRFSTEFRKVEQIPIQRAPCIYVVVGHKG